MIQPVHEIQRRVEFYETDMAGIVHFSNFFRYMESCEHAFIRSLGHEIHGLIDEVETGWPRVHASCDYRAPAHFGDLLDIRLFIEEFRPRSIRYLFHVVCEDTLVAEGRLITTHVALTSDGIKAVALPAALRKKLRALSPETPQPDHEK